MADLKKKRIAEAEETFPLTVTVEGLGPVALRYRRNGIKGSVLRRVVEMQKRAQSAEATGDELGAVEAVLESLDLRASSLLRTVTEWDLEDDGEPIPLTEEECRAREDDDTFWEVVQVLLDAVGKALSPNPPTPST